MRISAKRWPAGLLILEEKERKKAVTLIVDLQRDSMARGSITEVAFFLTLGCEGVSVGRITIKLRLSVAR